MQLPSPGLYARWREEVLGPPILAESPPDASPAERVLQLIWLHQRLQAGRLRTLDGRPVRVLHPGFWNHEAGPDFRRAVLEIDGQLEARCDIEVDLVPAAWRQHHHDRNPAYRGVRLHVVWRGNPGPPGALPTLPLVDALDAPVASLVAWAQTLGRQEAPSSLVGLCARRLRVLPEAALGELLSQAAEVRLRTKAAQFEVAARQGGWEQALWEGLFAALGYKQNAWPMRHLARLVPRLAEPGEARDVFTLQARLLGLAGFLPAELPRSHPAASEYVRRAWDVWWRWRADAQAEVLPRALWRLDGVRPANHPQRRLALAAHWLAAAGWPSRLEAWLARAIPDGELADTLAQCLQPAIADDFWSRHATFASRPSSRPQALLGFSRATDLALNVVLPWLWSRAATGRSADLTGRVEQRYRAWPASQDNALLRLARQRVLGGCALPRPVKAVYQQGLLQLLRDFCDHSDALCRGCRLPALLERAGGRVDDQAGCGA